MIPYMVEALEEYKTKATPKLGLRPNHLRPTTPICLNPSSGGFVVYVINVTRVTFINAFSLK